jgi:hypothetical protein
MDNIHEILLKKYQEKYDSESRGAGIEEDRNIALSNYQINDILHGKTNILTYSALHKIKDINELLEPYKNFILLYMSKPNYGHWICVLKHPDRIEFFDPYGGNNIPDQELDSIKNDVKEITYQNYPYLSELIYKSGMPIEYNNYRFQEHNPDIKTCGRHCIVRVLFKNLLLDNYYDLMTLLSHKYNMNYDNLVTFITTHKFL